MVSVDCEGPVLCPVADAGLAFLDHLIAPGWFQTLAVLTCW